MEHAGGFHPAAHFEENDASLLGIEVEDASRYGRLEVSADHRLTALREKQPGRGLDQVRRFPGWKLHPLKRDLIGFWTLTVTGKWAITRS